MGFRCGIVGLPNVGKSTLFNALTETAAAQAANYPFCTIEPNVGRVAVPDPRLDKIREVAKSAQEIETQIEFVDIAGLVRGASKGEGLGNQFLANIREVDAIVHVLRCFEGGDVTHVEGRVDPIADAVTVETEVMLADLESLERRVPNVVKKAQQGDKEAKVEASVLGQALDLLRASRPARLTRPKDHEEENALQRARQYSQQVFSANIMARLAHEDTVQARAAMLPTATGFSQFIYTQPNGTPSGVFVSNDGPHVYNDQVIVHGEIWNPQRRAEYRRAIAAEAVARARVDLATRGLIAR